AKPVDEVLFLLYVLEDLYRTTVPTDDQERTVVQKHKAFLARQTLIVDQVRKHIQKRKLGNDLDDLFGRYRGTLLKLREQLASELEERWQKRLAAVQEVYRVEGGKIQQARAAALADALLTGIDYGRQAWRDPWTTADESFAVGLAAGFIKA